jgi:hypothetical protein
MTEVVGSIKPFMRASVAQQSSAPGWRYRCFLAGGDAFDGDFLKRTAAFFCRPRGLGKVCPVLSK